jgi:energy-converting hydrogenase Eha subunit E
MSLDLAIKFIGWVFAGVPLLVFLGISGTMVWGAAQDDEVIKAVVMLALSVFAIGVLILVVAYFTTFLTFDSVEETAGLLRLLV